MAFDVEQYASLGPGERMAIDRMRALAMLWLNERLALFSVLSADDGEWPLQQEHEKCASAVAFMGELIERMEHEASCMVNDEPWRVVWWFLEEQAQKYGIPAIVQWEAI